MADKFASVAGSGAHDGSTAGNAWTIAEATAAVVAGDTVNVLAGTYIADDSASSAVMDLDVAGTGTAWIIWEAYTTTIGDFSEGDAQPVVLNAGTNTLTNCVQASTLTGNAFNQFKGFRFTGASSNGFDGGAATDIVGFFGCKFDANGAVGVVADNNINFIGCEFTGNSTGSADVDSNPSFIRCLFHNEVSATGVIKANDPKVINSTFYDLGASEHIRIQNSTNAAIIMGCTFDGDGDASSVAIKTSGATTVIGAVYNNIIFDCGVGVDLQLNFILDRGNNLFSNCLTDYSTLTNDPTDISNSVDPFTDSASRDYTLATGSAARSAGVDGGIF